MDCRAILKKRTENCTILRELLQHHSGVSFLPNRPQGSALYFPILVEARDQVQRTLASKGIYCPVIWPIPTQCVNSCIIEKRIESSMLALPCDQRYNAADMYVIAKTVINVTEGGSG